MIEVSGTKKIIAVLVVAALIAGTPLVLSGLSRFQIGSAPHPGASGGQDSKAFFTLSTLKRNSTIIAVGTVGAIVSVYGNPGLSILHTIFKFTVTQFVKGSAPSSLNVADYGGTLGNVTVSPVGAPLVVSGGSYLLFLSNKWGCGAPSSYCIAPATELQNSTYGIVASPQGKFVLSNGLVYGYKTLYPQENQAYGVDANGESLAQFVSRVLSA